MARAELAPGWYSGTIQLRGMEATFGDASDVRDAFSDAGFVDVAVRELGDDRYHARGRWPGPVQSVELPTQLVAWSGPDASPSSAQPVAAPRAERPAALNAPTVRARQRALGWTLLGGLAVGATRHLLRARLR